MAEPIFDARKEAAGKAGLHVLIVGISEYLHLPRHGEPLTPDQQKYGLGLERLTSAARTGHQLYRWLLASRQHLSLPLVTCRLLLAPSQDEVNAVSELKDLAVDARLDAFLEAAAGWRKDASSHADNMTLFYFAGHGFQRKRGDQVMLLADVGSGIGSSLRNAVDTYSLMQGMVPSADFPQIGRQQLYFIDACRLAPIDAYRYEMQDCTRVWDVPAMDPDMPDDRASPVFYTALPGAAAYAIPGDQTIFGKALMWCLEGGSAERVEGNWCVTIDALPRGLRYVLGRLREEHNIEQDFRLDGFGEPIQLNRLEKVPDVDVDLEIRPSDQAHDVEIVADDLKHPRTFGPPLDPHPFRTSLRAGNYQLNVRVLGGPGRPPVTQLEKVEPPYSRLVVDL
jgi:hypothetical protein